MMSTFHIIFFTIITLFSCLTYVSSQSYDYPTANLSTLWITGHGTFIKDNRLRDSPNARIILRRQRTSYSTYACCFYCDDPCDSYLFAVLILRVEDSGDGLFTSNSSSPRIVWSANRNNPVGINSTLELTGEGDLVLRDGDGTLAWSTNTAGRSVARLSLTETGNLVLLDANSSVVWQSSDHPTDCLVPGQILKAGTNLTEKEGLYSVLMTEKGLVASIQSDPPQVYYQNLAFDKKRSKQASYAKFQNGSLDLYITKVEPKSPDISITIPKTTSPQYMKLGNDGHLRVVRLDEITFEWNEVADIFREHLVDGCGEYGICSNEQCSCPSGSSFRPINDRQLNQVKSLDGVGHIKKSFLAEVQSIGSIHHINLVRLIGFCAEKSHRLLVYAYMCNGSLERWIYCKSLDKMLEWNCRRKIILDIAKGLAYLHEDSLCLQSDPEKRPSMSMVVKTLEGVSSVQKDIDYNLLISQIPQLSPTDTTTLLPSLLSGPR
ncbi:hypothetical protein ACS0TY_017555 [Phlomoides rotata]